jgi:hypothetical protein
MKCNLYRLKPFLPSTKDVSLNDGMISEKVIRKDGGTSGRGLI